MPVSTLIVSARGRGRRHEILSHEKLYDCLRLLFFCIHRSTKVKDFKNHPAAYMYVSSKMMGKPRGALETTTITTHIETSSFRHPKNVGPLYYVEFLVKNFTPSMWRKPQRPCDLFSICGVLTLRLLPQATLTPLLHAAPLCVAAASCSPSLDSTGPLGPHDRPSATVDWIIRCLEDIFLGWRPVNQCTNSSQNASKRAFLQ